MNNDQSRYPWGDILFYLVFFYFTIGFSPFISLSTSDLGIATEAGSNLFNQLTAVCLFCSVLAFMRARHSLPLVFKPRLVLTLIFGWYILTSLAGGAPVFSMRRLAMCAIICVVSGCFLQLPRSERHFSQLLATCSLIVLFLCYFGVAFLPSRSIHLASDALEPLLAGNWRGVFQHKNEAASVMGLLIFVSIYLCRRWSLGAGIVMLLLCSLFLLKSGGKTVLGLTPPVLVMSWAIVHWPRWRYAMVSLLIGFCAYVTISTTLDPEFFEKLTKLGIDASFTGRTDIWTIAIDYIGRSPLLGYGYQAFWRSDALLSAFTGSDSWATTAPTAHNSYFDLVLEGGIPGLFLVMVWLCFLPLYHIGKMTRATRLSPLTLLFVCIWLHVLLYSFLESMFMQSAGFGWFFVLVAVMGLHLQANANLHNDPLQNAGPTNGSVAQADVPKLSLDVASRKRALDDNPPSSKQPELRRKPRR